jgi:hydroxymethylpyrimidine pyrophosphatase-like HAD family hydrolase
VAADLAHRGLEPLAAVAVGDSAEDAALAPMVRAVFIVANGRPALEGLPLPKNVYLTEGTYGDGFAEVVAAIL